MMITRCIDKTTFRLNFKHLGKCGGSVLPLDPTDGSSEWRCRKCNTEIDTSLVIKIVTSISSQIGNFKKKDILKLKYLKTFQLDQFYKGTEYLPQTFSFSFKYSGYKNIGV